MIRVNDHPYMTSTVYDIGVGGTFRYHLVGFGFQSVFHFIEIFYGTSKFPAIHQDNMSV